MSPSQQGEAHPPIRERSVYHIEASRLEGAVTVSGAKNSVLRLMVASLLTVEPVRLLNYPATLLDAEVQRGMLEALGKRCALSGDELTIVETEPPSSVLRWSGRSIRNTLLALGALTARTGAGETPLPGGCDIGERRFDLHVMLLERLGAHVSVGDGVLRAEAPRGLAGAEIRLPIRSTGATENAILCGALARGRTTIWGPHVRPEILDLVAMLRRMGARITLHGAERIEIEGVETLKGACHTVIPDNMEAMTWMIAAAMAGGEVEVRNAPLAHLEVPLAFLRASGLRCFVGEDSVLVRGGPRFPVEISTGPYPGINSDMQPLFAVFAAGSPGESRIVDLRFPGRYAYAAELARMGLDVVVDGAFLRLRGGPLRGAAVRALDLRAGAALALAAMTASGHTTLSDAWQIERGYDRFVDKARGLGARLDCV